MKEMLEIKENLKKDFLLKNVGATHEVLLRSTKTAIAPGTAKIT